MRKYLALVNYKNMDRRLALPFRSLLLKPLMTGVEGARITDVVFNTNSEYEVKGGYLLRKGVNFRHGYVKGILRRILRLDNARETIKMKDQQTSYTYLIQDHDEITNIVLKGNDNVIVLNKGESVKLPDSTKQMLIVTNVDMDNTGKSVELRDQNTPEPRDNVIPFPIKKSNF